MIFGICKFLLLPSITCKPFLAFMLTSAYSCAYSLIFPNAIGYGYLPCPWEWHWREGRVGRWMQRVRGGGRWSKTCRRRENPKIVSYSWLIVGAFDLLHSIDCILIFLGRCLAWNLMPCLCLFYMGLSLSFSSYLHLTFCLF